MEDKIVIIGSGPCGLGAAWRLNELGHKNFIILEQADVAGGLAGTFKSPEGFLFDNGGHVTFSHYKYFDDVSDHLLGKDWLHHQREAWVWIRDRFVPYPFQNNIWRLPEEDIIKIVDGLLDIHNQPTPNKPTNFKEWILQKFGPGLADVFMIPYNFKVWAHFAEDMDCQWMGERVTQVNTRKVVENVINKKDEVGWGPNATFRFPLHGGSGGLWTAMAEALPQEKFRLNAEVVKVDTEKKTVYLKNGESHTYDKLMSTMPADCLLRACEDQKWGDLADEFKFSSVHIVGIGIEGTVPDNLKTKCWMYFPEDNCPFFRVTVFSNYSPNNVPDPKKHWSLMCEVSQSPFKPYKETEQEVIEDVIQGLMNTHLLKKEDKIVCKYYRFLHYGYPTPWLGRDKYVNEADKLLLEKNIWTRGRFGGWRYEVANQDHSFMQGVEAADSIVFGTEETTFRHPSVVNTPPFSTRPYPSK